MLYKNTNQLIANSHGTKNYLCKEWGLDKQNVHVIHNGVNSNKIKSLAEDDCLFEWYKESLPIINTIGRLSPQKNHACLIKAFSIVRERTQSRLVIIGEGPLRQSLEELARIVCVAEDTWFAGYQNNPYKFLARSTVFVLPSKWEGFPNVLLEAMVCRVPVISTDVDFGPREIIDHGKTGFLVSSDDPEILADQILYILENRSGTAIKGIISNARKKVETEFSLEVMVKKYQEYFTDVYNSHYAWLH
jgi:glycosyltransferase involved in cell wall biosynthesis